MLRMTRVLVVGMMALSLGACEEKPAPTTTTAAPAAPKASGPALPAGLFLASAPGNAKAIKEAKEQAKQGEKIVLTGRIGGSEEPFVEGRAVFTVVDLRLKYCGEVLKDDHCKTPWDYCCEAADDLAANSATVQIVDAEGKPLKVSLTGVSGLKPLAVVTVAGTVAEVADGNLLVRAEGIHVTP